MEALAPRGGTYCAIPYLPAKVNKHALTLSRAPPCNDATPIDLAALIAIDQPVVRVRYEYADAGEPTLASVMGGFLTRLAAAARQSRT